MKKKTLIFDLDNTIYAVSSIAGRLFAPLFQLLEESEEPGDNLNAIKQDLMRKPFQWIAEKYGFSQSLTEKGVHLLQNLTYDGQIEPFPDYEEIKKLPQKKFLVTSGFQKLQQSKIEKLQLEQDFEEIVIVDVEATSKKEVFAGLLQRYNLVPSAVLAIGDDPDSELKAARELGIDAVLYNHHHEQPNQQSFPVIFNYRELPAFL